MGGARHELNKMGNNVVLTESIPPPPHKSTFSPVDTLTITLVYLMFEERMYWLPLFTLIIIVLSIKFGEIPK